MVVFVSDKWDSGVLTVTPVADMRELKQKLTKEWTTVPQRFIRDSCRAFTKRLQQVVDAERGYME